MARYRSQMWLLGAAVLMLLFIAESAFAQLEGNIQHELKRNPAGLFKNIRPGYTHEDINKILNDIYQKRQYQPYWHKGPALSERGEVALSYLESAPAEGLHAHDYHLDILRMLNGEKSAKSRAQLDIVLTMAVGRYVGDIRAGRLGIRKVDPELFATAREQKVDVLGVILQAFEAQDIRRYFQELAPPNHQYVSLKNLLAQYRQIAQKGGWELVPPGAVMKPGMRDPRIPLIRRNLGIMGDYKGAPTTEHSYDPVLEAAMKHFQERHGLNADGVIGKGTLRALNTPVEERIKQISVNMERWRWNARDLGGRHVIVNIAGFQAGGVRDENLELAMRAVVGKTHHKTPVFSKKIEYLEFNPYWNVTASIARNEYLPQLRKDPASFKAKGLRVFKRWGDESSEIDPITWDWQNTSPSQIAKFHIRQEPGPKNALGKVKFMFPNDYSVYMHDTPAHSLFAKDVRAFSHGCIRLSEPLKMAEYVLSHDDPSWTMDRIQQVVDSKKRTVVKLKTPLPVHITYRTAVVQADGTPRFYEDLYKRDTALEKAIYRSG